MKNILTAVFLFGFLGISTGAFAQHLRLLQKNLPCETFNRLKWYKLYIQASPPDIPGVNTASIQITNSSGLTMNLGISGVGGQSGEKVAVAASPTGWAYCVSAKISTPNNRQLPPFTIEETDTYNNRTLIRILEAKAKVVAAPIEDVQLVSSDLCNGMITLKATTNSAVDGYEYSHESYQWYHGTNLLATTSMNTASLNIGAANASSPFDIKVIARNGVCSSVDYTKSFDPTIGTINNSSIIDPITYCTGTANTPFEIQNPTPGVEYEWTFITTTSWETAIGLDLTKYYATFRSNDVFVYVRLRERVNCGSWQNAGQPIFKQNIQTQFCGGSLRLKNNDLMNLVSLSEDKLKVVNGTTNEVFTTEANHTSSNKLTTLDNEDNALVAFPNPTTGLLELRSEGAAIEAVKVYNVTGVLVTQKLNVASSNPTIDLSSLPKGMYLLNIQTAETSKTIQVIKE